MPSRQERSATILHDEFAFGQPSYARFMPVCGRETSRSEEFHRPICVTCPVLRTLVPRPASHTERSRVTSPERDARDCPGRNRHGAVLSDGSGSEFFARPAGALGVCGAEPALSTGDLTLGRQTDLFLTSVGLGR